MRGRGPLLLILAGLFLLAGIATAEEDFFGPKKIKVRGAKKIYKATLAGPEGRAVAVEITNGVKGRKLAKSVRIVFNGNKVCTKKDVNRKVASASMPLVLRSRNKLKIVVRGSGAVVKVRIVFRRADFKRLAGYGDSLLAGFQDGTLVEGYQVWGLGAQIARQAKAKFVLPRIAEPGIPPRVIEPRDGNLYFVSGGGMGYRLNPNERCDNLAVPGSTVATSLLVKDMGNSNPLYKIILGGRRTMIEEIVRRKPTFVFLWIGSNDVLGMALKTDPAAHTRFSDFKIGYEAILKELRKSGASVVAANLPDVTTIAFLVPPHELFRLPGNILMPITTYLKLRLFQIPLSSLTPDDYLSYEEIEQIRATIRSFNTEIEKLCEKYGVPVVDAYTLSRNWKDYGVAVAGRRLTTKLRDGLFSLDGVHPTNTGHALLANAFIQVINRSYGASIKNVDVASVFWQDPNRPTGFADSTITIYPGGPDPYAPVLRILLSAEKTALNKRRGHLRNR